MRKFISALFIIFIVSSVALAQDSELTPYEIALQRIEEARVSGATELDLYGFGLSTLPPEIGQLEHLQGISLWDNQLTTLPPEIGNLSNLYSLNLDGNQLNTLPPEFVGLSQLHGLRLRANQFTIIPTVLGELPSLEFLVVEDNPLISPPPAVIAQGTPAILDYLNSPDYVENLISLVAHALWNGG